MKAPDASLGHPRERPWEIMLGRCVFLLCMLTAIAPLRGGVQLSPDSVNFIVAAQNLIEHGELFVFSNWPSRSMAPGMEPFTDFPPGYSLYLIPFLLLFQEPLLATTVAHALAIAGFFCALGLLARTLRWNVLLRIAGYLTATVFTAYAVIHAHFWTEPLFIGCTLALAACTTLILRHDERHLWWWAAVFAFVAGSLKVVGILNLVWFVAPVLRTGDRRTRKALLALLACGLPMLLWFTRNLLKYGRTSFSHQADGMELKHTLLRPFRYFMDEAFRLAEPTWPSFVVLGIVITAMTAPYLKHGHGWRERISSPHAMLCAAFAVHFFGIWSLSLVASFSLLDDRLLSPSLTLGMIAVLNGIHEISHTKARSVRAVISTLPFIFLMMARHTTRPPSPLDERILRPPPEAETWHLIRNSGALEGATHFYSDRDFRHQLYARLPQRIIWDTADVATGEGITQLLRTGHHPFFVMHEASPEHAALENALARSGIHLERTYHEGAGLMVYTSPAPQ